MSFFDKPANLFSTIAVVLAASILALRFWAGLPWWLATAPLYLSVLAITALGIYVGRLMWHDADLYKGFA